MSEQFNGKGDWSRPFTTTREERELRKEYMWGEITLTEFNKRLKKLEKQGLTKKIR